MHVPVGIHNISKTNCHFNFEFIGMLGKRVEDLAKAVTDLIVRQKQVTVGMPPHHEKTITGPLPEVELRQIIHQAYGDDESTAMLTQVIAIYSL